MNDRENEIYTFIRNAVKDVFPSASVSDVYLRVPPSFPHVSIMQIDSSESKAHIDSSMKEKFTQLSFQIDIYSDDETRKKTICKVISQIVDETMKGINFRRQSLRPVPNLADATIYRITARYTGIVSDDGMFYAS